MTATSEHLNRTVISVEDLKHHYSFQLKRVGFPQSKALDTAALMVQSGSQLTHLEQSRILHAISILEEQKAIYPPLPVQRRRVRPRSNRPRAFELASPLL